MTGRTSTRRKILIGVLIVVVLILLYIGLILLVQYWDSIYGA
jgi:hypothetical protein